MQKIIKKFFSAPSIRLNVFIIVEVLILLVVSLGGLFYFTRKALIEESKMDAEQRLENAVQHADNVLITIEQTAGNFYHSIVGHLDQPDLMTTYCRKLVECNPNIEGCVIAFKPNYYPDRELFINYVRRKKYNSPELITLDESVKIPYTQHKWYSETMKTGRATWLDPGKEHESYKTDPVITFCMPILDNSKACVGVMAVGLSIDLLSNIVLESKPTPNSYCIMLDQDGSYLVHPNHELHGQKVFRHPDIAESPSATAAAQAMVKGKTGNGSFVMNDFTWYLFYKPFVHTSLPGHSTNTLRWSIASVYPKSDIFGEYNYMVLHVLGIVLAALLVFYILCRKAIRKRLKPLIYLTESAERIANGHYDETIPNVKRDDEVGVFYKHFQAMQQALAADISKHEERKVTLRERNKEMQKIQKQIQEDDQIKNTFLHNITNMMVAPAESINDSVFTLCDNYKDITLPEANQEINNIRQQGETILELLSEKFKISPNETGKEDSHE